MRNYGYSIDAYPATIRNGNVFSPPTKVELARYAAPAGSTILIQSSSTAVAGIGRVQSSPPPAPVARQSLTTELFSYFGSKR